MRKRNTVRKARGAAFPGVAWFEVFIPGNPGLVGEQVGRMGRGLGEVG